jgi:serine protease Do
MKIKILVLSLILCLAGTAIASGATGAQEGSGNSGRSYSATVNQLQGILTGGSWLGVQLSDVTEAKVQQLHLPGEYGVIVARVEQNSPAAKAGVKANDAIVTFGGMRVWSAAQFARLVRETPLGRTVTLGIIRDGKKLKVTATLERSNRAFGMAAPNPLSFYTPVIRFPQRSFDFDFGMGMRGQLGVQGEALTSQLAAYFNVSQGRGVLVEEVEPGSPAEKSGLKAGDCIVSVDASPVDSIESLRRALRRNHGAKGAITIGIVRHGHPQSVSVNLESRWNPNPAQVASIDAGQLQQQVQELEKQLPSIDAARLQQQVQELEKQLPSIDAARLQRQVQELEKQLPSIDVGRIERQLKEIEQELPELQRKEHQLQSCVVALESHLFKNEPNLVQNSAMVNGPNGIWLASGPGCKWNGVEEGLLDPPDAVR